VALTSGIGSTTWAQEPGPALRVRCGGFDGPAASAAQTRLDQAGHQPLARFPEGAGRVHIARAAVPRAERAATALAEAGPVNPAALAYLNRLSDYLFVLARAINAAGSGDVLWVPGKNR